jgi:Xaa-Pro aminopeptidase
VANNALPARRARAAAELAGLSLDALLVSHLPNIRYLTGFTGSNGLLILGADARSVLFTDPRYEVQAHEESAMPDCRVRVEKSALLPAAARAVRRVARHRVGFEATRISYRAHAQLAERLKGCPELVPTEGFVERHRMLKSPEEIASIREAARLNSAALERSLRSVRIGTTTENELAAEIEHQMRRLGADGPAFETIVAAGPRAALPHARPTSAKISPGALLLIDMGASLRGYASDMTRVLAVGPPRRRHRLLYRAVAEAQQEAVAAVRPGVQAGAIDQTARRALAKRQLDHLFTHSTGHGLGLEIHEPPRLGRKDATPLAEGMTITVEPGVYLPGDCGIRVEDTVVVTASGCEVLTPTTQELRVL